MEAAETQALIPPLPCAVVSHISKSRCGPRLAFVVSHPFHDETVERMGHPDFLGRATRRSGCRT